MKISISAIKVNDRIRKDFGDIKELAEDIGDNGLINPILVTPDYQLIAGERRLRAHEYLGREEIDVTIMEIRDAEHQLKLEIAENEQRKEFTFSERIEWARKLERVERVKAEERKRATLVQFFDNTDTQNSAERTQGETRQVVAEQVGFGSHDTLRKAQFIADNADQETIDKLNQELISINAAYKLAKQQHEESQSKYFTAKDEASKLKREIDNLKDLADHLHEKWQAELNKPAQVIKETVEVQKIPDDYKDVKRKLQEKEDELLALTRAQLTLKDKFIIHDTFSGLAQAVGKHMKKLELEIVKYPGDQDVANNINSTIQILQASIETMKTWNNQTKERVIIEGDYTIIDR